jgi:hypothetical protein
MRDRARAPLDAWEEAEAERKAKHAEVITFLQRVTVVYASTTAAEVQERLQKLADVPETPAFIEAKTAAIEALTGIHTNLVKAEADRAELEALRAEKAKRDADEEAARRAEADRAAAEERAKIDAERKAAAAKTLEERIAHEREEAAAKAAATERAKAEAAEQERLTAERKAEEDRQRRETNARHRANVERKAIKALMQVVPLDEATATAVLEHIRNGEIPNVTIAY